MLERVADFRNLEAIFYAKRTLSNHALGAVSTAYRNVYALHALDTPYRRAYSTPLRRSKGFYVKTLLLL